MSEFLFGPAVRIPKRVRLGRPYETDERMEVVPHPDKAISQRATILAALADGRSRIGNLADCADTRSNLEALGQLGIPLAADRSELLIEGVTSQDINYRGRPLNAGNSATTARLLIAVLAGSDADCVVEGNALLRSRPMEWLVSPLLTMGGKVRYEGDRGRLPVRVVGSRLRGAELTVEVDSAQAVSALLFAGLTTDELVVINRRTAARDHTERLLRWTGLKVEESPERVELAPGRPQAFDLEVPGDPSAAAVLAALHLASPRAASPLTLRGVCLNPRRLGFFQLLNQLGGDASWRGTPSSGPEPVGTITVSGAGELDGGEVGGPEVIQSGIDELPLLAALASRSRKGLVIRDAAELRGKDTDRIASTVRLLTGFGVDAQPTADGLVVRPSKVLTPAEVRLPADHRLVFAACVLALLAGGRVVLDGVDAAGTSHPGLLGDLARYLPVEAT